MLLQTGGEKSTERKICKQIEKEIADFERLTKDDFIQFCIKLSLMFNSKAFFEPKSQQREVAKFIFGRCLKGNWSRQEFLIAQENFIAGFKFPFEHFRPANFFEFAPPITEKFKIELQEEDMPDNFLKKSIHYLKEQDNEN